MAAAPGRRRQLPHRTRRRASAAAAPPIRRWCAMTAGGCTGAASPAACRWRRGGVRGAAQGSRRDSAARATTAQRAGRLIGSGGRSYSSGGAQAEWRWARFTPPTTVLIVTFKCSVWRWRSRRLPLPQQPRDPRPPPTPRATPIRSTRRPPAIRCAPPTFGCGITVHVSPQRVDQTSRQLRCRGTPTQTHGHFLSPVGSGPRGTIQQQQQQSRRSSRD
jgi:hypothetical protein